MGVRARPEGRARERVWTAHGERSRLPPRGVSRGTGNHADARALHARSPGRRTTRSSAPGLGRGDVSPLRVPLLGTTPVGQGSRLPGIRRCADARALYAAITLSI